jgi:hypothetical protein
MATDSHPVRSLQELCEIRLLESISSSDDADDQFLSLPLRVQLLLFSRLRTKHARLRLMSKDMEKISWYMPRVDLQVYLRKSTNLSTTLESDTKRQSHQTTWRYINSARTDYRHPYQRRYDNYIRWDNHGLHAELPATKFVLCPHHALMQRFACECDVGFVSLWEWISSALLLYRVTATFGMPPASECDAYKSRWEAILQHVDGVSEVVFGEHKGASLIQFHGQEKASEDALSLLNYLVGPSFGTTSNIPV